MAESERASILNRIRRMTAEAGGAGDARLLERFAAHRDEAAFELLLWRHARLVYGVCLRVLHNADDAEDAFQATFLPLARHAGRIARREAVAGWLHRVAYHVALTARRRRARRDAREQPAGAAEHLPAPPNAETASENRELRQILDAEIGRLPARFRSAVVLCYLEGKSVDEAAVLLGCPRGTVASRLARGRERLRARLAGRGLAAPAGLAAFTPADAAPRPFALIPTLTAATSGRAAGGAPTDGALPPRVTALTEEVLRAMSLHKLKTVVVLIAFLGVLLAGGGLAVGLRASAVPGADPPGTGPAPQPEAAGKEESAGEKPAAKAPRAVTVSRPVRREAAPYQDYTGRLNSLRTVEVRPGVSGFVQKVCFKPGAEIKQGDVLFELDARAARLALDKAETELALAEAKKQQSDGDFKRAGSPQDWERAKERVAAAEAAVKMAKLEVARARLEWETTKVTAPMSGQVGRPLVDAGALVFRSPDRATLLTTIMSVDPIGVTFDVDEASFLRYQRLLRENRVKGAGSPLRIQLPGEDGVLREGTLDSFGDQVTPQGTVAARGSLPNRDRLLLPGMFARIRMAFGPPRPVLEVPEAAVLSDQGMKCVFVVGDGNVVRRRDVTTGPLDNGLRIVEEGLRAEDRVVIDGFAHLRPGDPVEPREKAAPPRPDPARDR